MPKALNNTFPLVSSNAIEFEASQLTIESLSSPSPPSTRSSAGLLPSSPLLQQPPYTDTQQFFRQLKKSSSPIARPPLYTQESQQVEEEGNALLNAFGYTANNKDLEDPI